MIFITLILIICGLFFKRNKIVFYLELSWIFILIAFNTGGIDYNNYQDLYKLFSEKLYFEINPGSLYSGSIYIFHKLLNGSLEKYTVVTTILAIIVIYKIILNISILKDRSSFVLSLFMIYPLIDNIIQKRNFLGMVIVMYAIINCNKKNKSKIKIFFKYILLIGFAIGFHLSMIFYILYSLIIFLDLKNIKKISKIGLIIGILLLPLIERIGLLFGNNQKVVDYILDKTNRLSVEKVVVFILAHFLFFLMVYICEQELRKQKKILGISEIIIKINYISLLIIPLYFFDSTFFRYYRNIFLLNYILVSNTMLLKKIKYLDLLFLSSIIFYILFYSIMIYFILGNFGYEGLVKPLFQNNSILKLFILN